MCLTAVSLWVELLLTDRQGFGYQLMTRMGWTEGKGLGKREQGSNTHVRIERRLDTAGIGHTLDRTGNSGLASGLLAFHHILQSLQPIVATPSWAENSDDTDSESDHRGVSARSRDPAVLAAAMYEAALRAGDVVRRPHRSTKRPRERPAASVQSSAKRRSSDSDADSDSRTPSAMSSDSAPGVRRPSKGVRRILGAKNVRAYSKHDLGAILGDFAGAWRPPTAAEVALGNDGGAAGEGLDEAARHAAATVLERSSGANV